MTEEPTIFMTRSDVEAMLRREKEMASVSSICLDLEPPYSVVTNPYPVGFVTSQCQKFDRRRGNTREHVVHFLWFHRREDVSMNSNLLWLVLIPSTSI